VRNEQAIFARVGLETEALRGFGTSDEVYFDRLEDQFNRLLESIDAAANAMGMVLDLQLNERAWMVDRVDSPVAFWLLGFIVPIATAALSWRLLVRPFLIGGDLR
jgi:hypothetical protein